MFNFKLSESQKKLALVIGCIGVCCVGFSERLETVKQCTVHSEKYVIAEYSEDYLSMSVDSKGTTTTTINTRYWSESASPVSRVVTVNGEVSTVVGMLDGMTAYGYGIPVMPRHNINMSNDYDFDNFNYHNKDTLTVNTYNNSTNKSNYFTDQAIVNLKCLELLNKSIIVKTWFGISYGSDF